MSFISVAKVLPAVLACAAARFDCLALVKPQFEVGRAGVGKGGVVRDADLRRGALVAVGRGRAELGAAVLGYASSGLPGPKGNLETFAWLAEAGRDGGRRSRGGGPGGGAVSRIRSRHACSPIAAPRETGAGADDAASKLAREARGRRCALIPRRPGKHQIAEGRWWCATPPLDASVDICFALGGDGTILNALRTLRRHRRAGVRDQLRGDGVPGHRRPRGGVRRARCGRWPATSRCCRCPASRSPAAGTSALAINDVSIHRQPGKRVADLEYSVGGDEVGRVRCDGLVVATPAGSTGYNLANGGPVMAWGVHGYVVSFIAPHSLTARTLVVAPGDRLRVDNRSQEEPVERHRRRAPGRACWRPASGSRRGSPSTRAPWPRCRAPPSTTACARSSGGMATAVAFRR